MKPTSPRVTKFSPTAEMTALRNKIEMIVGDIQYTKRKEGKKNKKKKGSAGIFLLERKRREKEKTKRANTFLKRESTTRNRCYQLRGTWGSRNI